MRDLSKLCFAFITLLPRLQAPASACTICFHFAAKPSRTTQGLSKPLAGSCRVRNCWRQMMQVALPAPADTPACIPRSWGTSTSCRASTENVHMSHAAVHCYGTLPPGALVCCAHIYTHASPIRRRHFCYLFRRELELPRCRRVCVSSEISRLESTAFSG
jgi:hypothetical protein